MGAELDLDDVAAQSRLAQAQLAALRKEAERYRWLRDGHNWPAAFSRCDAPEPLRGVHLDAEIDAAMASPASPA